MSKDEIDLLELLIKKAKNELTTDKGLCPQYISIHNGKLEGDTLHISNGLVVNHHLDDNGLVVVKESIVY